jgi:DNA-binding MarR family transcriptional regulator
MAASAGSDTDWSEVAVAMDRGLRAFADLARPVLDSSDAGGMSVANLIFLLSLGEGDARVSDVVRGGRYLGSNASYAFKTLQEGGWIDRRQDPGDRRNAVVSWTGRGAALAASVKRACEAAGPGAAQAVAALRSFETHCADAGAVR